MKLSGKRKMRVMRWAVKLAVLEVQSRRSGIAVLEEMKRNSDATAPSPVAADTLAISFYRSLCDELQR